MFVFPSLFSLSWKQHKQLSFATTIHARANSPALVCNGALRTTRPTMAGRLILKPPPLPEIGFANGFVQVSFAEKSCF